MKKELLVARPTVMRGIRRASLALGLCAALCGVLAGSAPAQAANLLMNPGFDVVGPIGPVTSFTGLGASPSAAAAWRVYHTAFGTTRTRLLPAPWGGGMIHVYTTSMGNGLLQAFMPYNQGPKVVKGAIRVLVVKGKIAISTGNGPSALIDATNAGMGVWEVVSAPNGDAPANTFRIRAVSIGGAEFYVDMAGVFD